MNTTVKVLLILSCVLAVLIGIPAMSYISAYNTANQLEQAIKTNFEDNQNVLSSYTKTIGEAAQIPEIMRDDLKSLMVATLDARYGADGSKAMFQFIREQNPTLDSKVYLRLQDIIVSGRKDFEVAQRSLLSRKQVYETNLGSFWTGTWMRIAGWPKINLADYRIVTDLRTQGAFKSGTEDTIQIRPK